MTKDLLPCYNSNLLLEYSFFICDNRIRLNGKLNFALGQST